jgi:hypothetical protein
MDHHTADSLDRYLTTPPEHDEPNPDDHAEISFGVWLTAFRAEQPKSPIGDALLRRVFTAGFSACQIWVEGGYNEDDPPVKE